MAEVVVSLLVHQLGNLLVEGNKLFGALSSDLQLIKCEFERMLDFLRAVDSLEDKDRPRVAVWVKQIRELAQDTEDVLDEYNLLLPSHSGRARRIFGFIKNLRVHWRLAYEVQSIKSRVRDISEGHQKYQGIYGIQEQASGSTRTSDTEFHDRGAALLLAEAELVGIDRPKSELLDWLLDDHSQLKVLSVVGMGGLRKTTLAKRVYADVNVRKQFQCRAWVTVSNFEVKEILMNLIHKLYEEIQEPMPQLFHSLSSIDELRECIRNFLEGRKYLIVFDDVWKTDKWDAIKYALCNGNSQSRVMLTTRIVDVASAPSVDFDYHVYEMKTLSFEESWILFSSKAFKNGCPHDNLKETAESIVRKCAGLPLAIVAVGGVLAPKDTSRIEDWERFNRSLPQELEDEGKLDRVKRILLLSFFDLPHHLKACLLFLSIFPEDHEMEFMQVIRLWVAEGFVEEKEGLTIEEVGESYLNELVNRSLLQVVETKYDGRLRAFGVHDILREIIISKSKKENIATIFGERTVSRWPNKVRRLAIQGPLALENHPTQSSKFKHLRSLVMFSAKDLPPKPLLSQMLCGGSKLLKVLDLRGVPLEVIPDEIFKLFLLTYLSLRRTNVKIIPKSIGKLRKLETLDLKHTLVTELPVEILKLRRLRHLLVYRYHIVSDLGSSSIQSFRFPYKIGSLVFLQKLSYIVADETNGVKTVTEIGKLAQLRRLGIRELRREDGKDLCASLERLTKLRSLAVASVEENEIIDLQYNLCSIPHLLMGLYLRGRFEKMPQWIPSLRGLTRCVLRNSRLKDEPLQYFEDLPNLARLVLVSAYEGKELHFKAGKFQRLKHLILRSLKELSTVSIEKSSMACIEFVEFVDCTLMEDLPSGIENLSKLQDLILVDMEEKLVRPILLNREKRTQAQIFIGKSQNGSYEWRNL